MRTITLRYAGECRECGEDLPVGAEAGYERRVGVFCPPCIPTDQEEIRAHRQEAADAKADRYEGWAAKRRTRANATLDGNRAHTDCHAFNTQPGHIPARSRIIAQNDRAFESLDKADAMQGKADRLRRPVRVKGDAARRDQAHRDHIRPLLRVGMTVGAAHFGQGVIQKVNKKTARIAGPSRGGGTYNHLVDLIFLHILKPVTEEATS